MRICIEKSTNKLIEMQSDATEGTLLENAINAGYNVADVEEKEVANEEYQRILNSQPLPILTIQDKTNAINAKYQPKLDTYKDNILSALAADGATQSTKIVNFVTKYNAQLVLKNAEMEALYI
jgi:hypothetical protein